MRAILTFLFLVICFSSTGQNCEPGNAQIDLNVNNISARLRNSGDLWFDGVSSGRYITPSDGINEVSAIFIGGLWIGGIGPNGSLKLAALQYRTGANGRMIRGMLLLRKWL